MVMVGQIDIGTDQYRTRIAPSVRLLMRQDEEGMESGFHPF